MKSQLTRYGRRKKYPAKIIEQAHKLYDMHVSQGQDPKAACVQCKNVMAYWAKIDGSHTTFLQRGRQLLKGFRFWRPEQ